MNPSLGDRFLAAGPFLLTAALVGLSPLFDYIIGSKVDTEFSAEKYLPENQHTHTPRPVIKRFANWAADVPSAAAAVFGPAVGLAFVSTRPINPGVTWLYFAFAFVGFLLFAWAVAIREPVDYAAKQWLKMTKVTIAILALYALASVCAFCLANASSPDKDAVGETVQRWTIQRWS